MMARQFVHTVQALVLSAVALTAVPVGLSAQSGDGYLLKQPRLTLKFESGYAFQRANGDIFDFVTEEHTLGRRDFDAPYFGAELRPSGFRATRHRDFGRVSGEFPGIGVSGVGG